MNAPSVVVHWVSFDVPKWLLVLAAGGFATAAAATAYLIWRLSRRNRFPQPPSRP